MEDTPNKTAEQTPESGEPTPTPGSDAPEQTGGAGPVADPTPTEIPEDLPKEPDKAAKAFQAMRKEIKALKDDVDKRKAEEAREPGAFQRLEEIAEGGEDVGDRELAQQALTEARQARVDAQLMNIYQKYPTLNPKKAETYDKRFDEMVAGVYKLQEDQYHRGNRKEYPNALEIADDLAASLKDREKVVAGKTRTEVETEVTTKEQAALEARSQKAAPQVIGVEEFSALQQATRKGDADATIARLKAGGFLEKEEKKK